MTTVVLCGMPDEERVLSNALPGMIVLSGTDKLNLPELVPANCTRIVVAGLFGGLAQGIDVDDICVASTIVDKADQMFSCDQDWNTRAVIAAAASDIRITIQPWYSSGITEGDTATQRRALFERYGATCIDDEARYAVAEAQRRGIPCNDFRSCSDTWDETLPAEARGNILDASGRPNLLYLSKTLRVKDIPTLMKVGADYMKSLNSLEAAAKACASVFAS